MQKAVFDVVQSRPVTPVWPQISSAPKTQINAALTNQVGPTATLTQAQRQIDQIPGSH